MRTLLKVKTHPRQSLIHKLFNSLATSLFGQALPYSEEKLPRAFPLLVSIPLRLSAARGLTACDFRRRGVARLTSWFEYFTHSNTCEWNPIYSLVEVLIQTWFLSVLVVYLVMKCFILKFYTAP